jgi:ubiquinone/menaquinone biosynthesis C-methylase UbiE
MQPPKNPPGSPLGTPQPWDLVASAYTEDVAPIFELFARDALRFADVAAGDRVLDVATGPGTLALLAAARGARVSAVDFAPSMIAELEKRAQGARDLDVRVADGQALPFADGAYDAAFSMFGLIFFPDRARGLAELHRVLRGGGRAVISSWAPFEGPFATVLETLRELAPEASLGAGPLPLSTPEEVTEEMSAAGFGEVIVHTVSHTVTAPSPASLWVVLQRSSAPLVLLRRALGEDRWAAISDGILARLESVYGTGSVPDAFTALLGVGYRPIRPGMSART